MVSQTLNSKYEYLTNTGLSLQIRTCFYKNISNCYKMCARYDGALQRVNIIWACIGDRVMGNWEGYHGS